MGWWMLTFSGPGMTHEGTDGGDGSILVKALGSHRNRHSAAVSTTGITNGLIRMATIARIAADIAAGCVWPKSSSVLAVFAAASGFLPMENPIPTSTIGPRMKRHNACVTRRTCHRD